MGVPALSQIKESIGVRPERKILVTRSAAGAVSPKASCNAPACRRELGAAGRRDPAHAIVSSSASRIPRADNTVSLRYFRIS